MPVSASRVSQPNQRRRGVAADARVAGTSCPLWGLSSLARGSSSTSAQRRRLRCVSQGSVVSQSSLHLRMYCVSVQLEGGDLARIRDVSAWQRLLKAKLDEQEELEMSRRSRSRVVTKVFTQADFRQDQETVVKQFHEQVLPVPLPLTGPTQPSAHCRCSAGHHSAARRTQHGPAEQLFGSRGGALQPCDQRRQHDVSAAHSRVGRLHYVQTEARRQVRGPQLMCVCSGAHTVCRSGTTW